VQKAFCEVVTAQDEHHLFIFQQSQQLAFALSVSVSHHERMYVRGSKSEQLFMLLFNVWLFYQ